jgi:hypothetical protein
MSKRGETHSDWAKAAALTNDEIEAQIAADPDEGTAECLWQSSNSGNEWIDPSFCPTTLGPR